VVVPKSWLSRLVQVTRLAAMLRVLESLVEVEWCGTLLMSYRTLLGKTLLRKLIDP
jgi:membrane protein CcdC involved in cytochrome C biogenesis